MNDLNGYKVGQKVCIVKRVGIGTEYEETILKGKVIANKHGQVKVNILNTKRVILFNGLSKAYFYDLRYLLFSNEKSYRKFSGQKFHDKFINIKNMKKIEDKFIKVLDTFDDFF